MSVGSRRRMLSTVTAAAVAVFGMAVPGQAAAESDAIPEACRLHPTQVLNPGCLPALTSDIRDPGITLPNVSPDVRSVEVLRPLVLDPATQTFVPGQLSLLFDSWVQNVGTVPLELTSDDPENPTTAMQCVSWTAHVCRERRVVGEFAWHEEHMHFHFQDFADYQLRRLAADGRPDYTDAGLLARSEKVSFCLLDVSLVDILQPAPPFYLTCGPDLQGVSPGWADVYGIGTPGQELPIEGLPNGQYALIVAMDASNRVYETDDTDNVVEVIVELVDDGAGGTDAVIVDKHRP